jgi:hypothetical protein
VPLALIALNESLPQTRIAHLVCQAGSRQVQPTYWRWCDNAAAQGRIVVAQNVQSGITSPLSPRVLVAYPNNVSVNETEVMLVSKDETQKPPDQLQNPFRTFYTEQDVAGLIASPRFLVAVDAYGAGHCSLAQMTRLAFSEPPYLPRNLDMLVFADLVRDVVNRIQSGSVPVPPEWKATYAEFYRDLPQEPIE